ncbi:hypothetical protein [Paraburkholderia diazotrophica]|uniref:Uncharacterized protein n=1 Tax=Paraburkholderia diazotrophica TaxID=667676 RepID=A0A1H6VX15_9BURK|nr:hypothetical protein [Paraburkholderia diazotrophica]SEJ06367.1 hypothetical protein SAMN05192539_1006134 [Paraburkholderia diazotrophica]
MSPELLFRLHLVLGYVTWLPCFGVYVWPRLKSMDLKRNARSLPCTASVSSGWPSSLPGVVSPDLPASFAMFAAYGDFATGVGAASYRVKWRFVPGEKWE